MRQVQNSNLSVFEEVSLIGADPGDIPAVKEQAVGKLVAALESRFTDRVESDEVIQSCLIIALDKWPSQDDTEGKINILDLCLSNLHFKLISWLDT